MEFKTVERYYYPVKLTKGSQLCKTTFLKDLVT